MKLKTAKLNLIVGAFFVINILTLPALATKGMAAGAEAGAAAGAAKAGAAALVIATSGGAGQAAAVPGAAQQATQNLQNNTTPTTQAATSSALLSLNSTETANLSGAAPAVLGGQTFGGVTLGTALTGVTMAELQGATAPLSASQLNTYLAALKTANLTAYNQLVALLKSIAARNSTTALAGLTNLAKAVEADKTPGAAAAVAGILVEAASNYVATINTVLTT